MAPDRMTPDVAYDPAWHRAPDPGEPDEALHAFLRRVTRPWHDGVERAFERFDLQTLDGLSGFLLGQATALFPLERALERSGVAEQLPDWPARRRAPALAADLTRLGLAAPPAPDLPDFSSGFEMLGALYVLEGSKLGGRILHRRVLASPDPQVRATDRFLSHRQERGWPGFLVLLDAVPRHADARAGLRDGARRAFAAFHAAAQREPSLHLADAPTRSRLYHQAHA